MWAGSPAKFIRNVTPEERERINELLNETRQLAAIHSEEASKTEE